MEKLNINHNEHAWIAAGIVAAGDPPGPLQPGMRIRKGKASRS